MVEEIDSKGIRISVVIPCYNYGQYLPEALESLRRQSFTQWECWVVDDGSTDETADIVQSMMGGDPRIHYVFQENSGQPAARNTGLLHARGDCIQFLDADDLLEPEKFSRQLAYLDEHSATDVVYGAVRYFSEDAPGILLLNRWGDPMKDWMPRISGRGGPLIRAVVEGNIFELGCGLFRKAAIDRIGPFDTRLQGVEDHAYLFRAAISGLHFQYLEGDHTRTLMRHHPGSYSKSRIVMYKKDLLLRRSMAATLRQRGDRLLLEVNALHYGRRLRRLQDHFIDQAIKQHRISRGEMKWVWSHSSLRQKLYFFPRMLKALGGRINPFF
ncbi:glycosyltransferase family 2 protein [Flavitalea sp. BT771]|uniref:glycosyltransferase family 2 protein n=1 Tax=Flavitalea sp. BT771 TaxID=3063329 RepID=UPI0026E39404|nr:glycosyltransferase family 2 protein [Flavitalea sp. BT771]MDO6430408.1 glycosyltransferase family 2 protein [Flavitalea sp. BT771]MDV6219452.1 glycosyltransferase family 2 protein [Flavitalea sp. BT771]